MGKIKAFKNFLNDFSTMDEKDLPDIKLWEKYLVYAQVFSLADELRKQIDSEDTPEWKRKQAESKLAMFLRKVAPHKIWDGKGTYRKQGDK